MSQSFTVPKFLSFVPKNRKPRIINLVFKKDPFDYNEDGFYATLLDLHKRKIIKIETLEETKSGGLRITLLKGHEAEEDEYEKKVLKFLEDYSKNNVFNTNELEHKIEQLRNKIIGGSSEAEYDLRIIRNRMNNVMKVPEKKAAEEYVRSGREYAWMLFGTFLFILIITSFLFSFGIYLHYSFIANHSSVICFFFTFRKVEGKFL